jgi:glycosyltransferase involved in cell wall biosynthesis
MRILLVNKFWWPKGGVELHCFYVQEMLERMGHEVIPFAMADERNVAARSEQYFPSAVEFRGGPLRERARAAGRATFGVETLRQLDHLLDEFPVDAAHVVHAYHQLGTSFLRMLERRGIPTVLSLHDYKLACPSYRLFDDRRHEVCTKCLDQRGAYLWAPIATGCWDGSRGGGALLAAEALTTKLTRAYTRGPGAVIVLNELQRRVVERAGVAPDKIHKVPHGVEIEPPSNEPRGDHALFVGRLAVEKGVADAIEACSRSGMRLLVLGDGPLRDDLEKLAAHLGADVEFRGHVTQDEVMAEMRRARLLLVPSRWHEVLALVIVQAIATHLPVVATDLGGNPDLLGDGRGFLHRPAGVDELTAILTTLAADPARATAAAANAAAWATSELTEERWISRMRAVYDTVGVSL